MFFCNPKQLRIIELLKLCLVAIRSFCNCMEVQKNLTLDYFKTMKKTTNLRQVLTLGRRSEIFDANCCNQALRVVSILTASVSCVSQSLLLLHLLI